MGNQRDSDGRLTVFNYNFSKLNPSFINEGFFVDTVSEKALKDQY